MLIKKKLSTARYKNFVLATFGKNVDKNTSPNTAKVIKTLHKVFN